MVDPIRNQRPPVELTTFEVDAALARIEARSAERRLEAGHVFETLTWGEGPGVLTQHGLQDWLWYRLPTKYLTDEPDYMERMAGIAAELFDELGLDWYAAICRSVATAAVHHAFDHSDEDGYSAMRTAMEGSGIRPPTSPTSGGATSWGARNRMLAQRWSRPWNRRLPTVSWWWGLGRGGPVSGP